MDFIDIRFPTWVRYQSINGPVFNNTLLMTKNGYPYVNANWSNPLFKFTVSLRTKDEIQLRELQHFFLTVNKGQKNSFRFKYHDMYTATDIRLGNQLPQLGIGDNSETDFQLIRSFQYGSKHYNYTVKKPVEGTVHPYLDGVYQTSGFTVNYSTGLISFSSPPASGVVVQSDFLFDIPVFMLQDEQEFQPFANNVQDWNTINLVEDRSA